MVGHNQTAPFFAVGLFVFLLTGLSTVWFDFGSFWQSYLLDMVGPAWSYILFRGLFTTRADNIWFRFFTPLKTFLLFLFFCFGVELLQFFQVYPSTFDPFDFLAYLSLLFPLFLFDFIREGTHKQ